MVADLGEAAALRFIDFFTANIRNPNTRAAYAVAVRASSAGRTRGVPSSPHPHAPRLRLRRAWPSYKAPTVKQHLAAIRMLFDWLIVGQVGRTQPPRCAARSTSSRKARRRCSTATRPRQLLDSIDIGDRRRPARPGADRAADLQLRPDLGRAAHERRGLLPAGQALVGPAARERRQAARDARAPPAGDLHRRLCHRRRHRSREKPLPCSARSAVAGASSSAQSA